MSGSGMPLVLFMAGYPGERVKPGSGVPLEVLMFSP